MPVWVTVVSAGIMPFKLRLRNTFLKVWEAYRETALTSNSRITCPLFGLLAATGKHILTTKLEGGDFRGLMLTAPLPLAAGSSWS